jgi:hypothetical protein
MSDQAIVDRLDRLRDEIAAMGRILGLVLTNQDTTADLVAKVLEKVSSKGDSDKLTDLLARLLAASDKHTEQLETIMDRIFE